MAVSSMSRRFSRPFDRIVNSGAPELVLVSGYAGIGKSSVVNELHPVLVPPRGLFASGKFDQYKRDIPYATLAQAFHGLVRPLLSKSDSELNPWRDALKDALGDLIEDVLTGSDLQHLMLIGAYRDNEVGETHPLRRKLDAIKVAGGKVAEINLQPLGREHLGQLIADTLRCDPERTAPLAQLVLDKTAGNPFFAIQFIASLAIEGVRS